MPELPEVETIRTGLEQGCGQARIIRCHLNRPDLRFRFPENLAKRIENTLITAFDRRAKYLLIHLDHGYTLVSHLGMSGSWRIEAGAESALCRRNPPEMAARVHTHTRQHTHDHFVLEVNSCQHAALRLIYNDPRRFGFIDYHPSDTLDQNKHLKTLGFEPLNLKPVHGELMEKLARKHKSPLKSVLLDQRVVAGIGNIYACEILWLARLSPFQPAAAILNAPPERFKALVNAVQSVLKQAIKAGGSTLRDHTNVEGEMGYFQHRFKVYAKEGEACQRRFCKSVIHKRTLSGRSTFFCPLCQNVAL